ncbi:gliding motility-associated C-terminal domain-containing protein [Pontibacter silvestris]|uniref:Gliding motility-associated C-terminal domain-containing protein n=1 Tax=Pontibacter silvestris TaxID=2305183 RepID=A0ABW4WUT9_9BACT|nr:gliding motility-associated C-terminal domain-containing protein [Pontibacter silvestris]MCC9137752.1 gliding motility-associated C-terminal domain-containing protein [Pontibacter silvestris]
MEHRSNYFFYKSNYSGKYWITATNPSGCSETDTVNISVIPSADIALPSEINVCYGNTARLNAATIADATYTWSTGQTTPEIEVASTSHLYEVTIHVNGCSYTRTIQIIEEECPIIPNIITLNNDGKNDTFLLEGANPENFALEILNRWGKSIYKTEHYNNKWPSSDLSTGTYYYLLRSHISQKSFKG